ncbi:hypothetical protein [Variovorax sp. JS1663]|uniref:hypothetical protein n=1 Tax=Variovorax sp. JS1663 TaxID=1851577 RepID=UPI000B342136|nr:hypothetical protein [Variovorax sp. JS1663]OUL99136.1 hypothetical protein A8M77_27870 [Variovorax sp. JS1663]
MTLDLWPPLSLIRSTLGHAGETPAGDAPPAAAAAAAAQPSDASLLMPLTELARRREAVAARAFPARWAPGRLVSVLHEGRLLGVLLDKCLHGNLWRGWMAASEADWASAYDVLLEPGDEPFEPMFGLIQTWNVLNLEQRPQLCARVLGELSATRLAAVRAVHDEWAVQQVLPIAPEPGRIALRTAGGVFTVLSGTPLGVDDPRADYQGLYLDAAARLAAPLHASTEPGGLSPPAAAATTGGGDWWSRLVGWFRADRVVRPALALLALVVVVQNAALLRSGGEEEEVRFRALPGAAAPAAAGEQLLLRWKPATDMADAQALLAAAGAEVMGGPDAQGRWRLRLAGGDAVQGRALLAASPLVESVEPP